MKFYAVAFFILMLAPAELMILMSERCFGALFWLIEPSLLNELSTENVDNCCWIYLKPH